MSNPVIDLKRELIAAAERQHGHARAGNRRTFVRGVHAPRLLPIGAAVAVAAAAALFVSAPWSSSAGPVWTETRMEAAIGEFDVKLVGVITDRFSATLSYHADFNVDSALCRGLGSRTRAGYGLFRCKLTYHDRGPGLAGPYFGSYWARPWNSMTVCVSNVSRGTCPPPLPDHPLRGDPRRCMKLSGVACLARAAGAAATAGLGVTNKRCVAGAVWTTYTCTWANGRATVEFIRHPHSWTTSITTR